MAQTNSIIPERPFYQCFRVLVSWYSSHEKDAAGKTITAIYLADLEIVE